MKDDININVIIDKKYINPKIDIYTDKETDDINDIVDAIKNVDKHRSLYINAYLNWKIVIVLKDVIVRIKRIDRQVILETDKESYILKKSLTKLEEELDSKKFSRISQSEIINAYKVKNLDINIIGTITIEFNNNKKSNVSRRFVKSVRKFFEN